MLNFPPLEFLAAPTVHIPNQFENILEDTGPV